MHAAVYYCDVPVMPRSCPAGCVRACMCARACVYVCMHVCVCVCWFIGLATLRPTALFAPSILMGNGHWCTSNLAPQQMVYSEGMALKTYFALMMNTMFLLVAGILLAIPYVCPHQFLFRTLCTHPRMHTPTHTHTRALLPWMLLVLWLFGCAPSHAVIVGCCF